MQVLSSSDYSNGDTSNDAEGGNEANEANNDSSNNSAGSSSEEERRQFTSTEEEELTNSNARCVRRVRVGGEIWPSGGDSKRKHFGLKNGLRFHFDSETCLNYQFLNIFLLEGISSQNSSHFEAETQAKIVSIELPPCP